MTQTAAVDLDEAVTGASVESAIELMPSRQAELLGFHFKVRASGRIYRLDPARDPQQPRFWCFCISRCSSSGVIDEKERPWFGGDRMTRDQLTEAVATIRTGLENWLDMPQSRNLRDWILEDAATAPLPPELAPASTLRSRSA